jgi:hypothetical protein
MNLNKDQRQMQRKHNKLEDVFIAYQEIEVSRIFEHIK